MKMIFLKRLAFISACIMLAFSCSSDDASESDEDAVQEDNSSNTSDDSSSDDEGGGSTTETVYVNILFIGNSFTQDAVNHLPGIVQAAGIGTATMIHMYYGGRTVPEYYEGFSTSDDYTCYRCQPGESSWTTLSGLTLEQVCEAYDWDIVTIQEHTGKSNAWEWTDTEKEALQGLIDLVKETQEEDPEFYYIMSQAYGDPAVVTSDSYTQKTVIVNNFDSSQSDMYDTIVAQAKTVMNETDFDGIIATGTMLQNLRTSSLENEMDLTRDGYHMDYGLSRYGAACTVFETLFTPIYDVKLDDNYYRYSTSSTTFGSYSTPVTDDNHTLALSAARYAISNPYFVVDMSTI